MPIEVAPARLDARPSSPADAGANGRDFLGEDPSLSTATIVPATGFATSFTIDGTIVFQTDTNGEADRDKEDDAFDPARSTLPSEDRRAAVAHETGFELAFPSPVFDRPILAARSSLAAPPQVGML